MLTFFVFIYNCWPSIYALLRWMKLVKGEG
uniref:Uncharacterized protein n=1 Tax=Anguilla anguilla TaxID=7936 RepID=A0A0E9TCQ3_ANGAN